MIKAAFIKLLHLVNQFLKVQPGQTDLVFYVIVISQDLTILEGHVAEFEVEVALIAYLFERFDEGGIVGEHGLFVWVE